MGIQRTSTSVWSGLRPENIIAPEKRVSGMKTGYIQKTHSDLRNDPVYQAQAEKFLSWLAEERGAADKISGGLINNDIFETMRDEEGRLGTAIDRARIMRDAPQEMKETYRYLRDEFEESKAGSFGEIMKATLDRGVDIFADPINLLFLIVGGGLGGVGAGTAARASATAGTKAATSAAGRRGIARTLHNISASNAGRAGAFEGAVWTGAENAARQDINISTEIQDAFSSGEFAFSTGLGLGLGAVGGHYLGGLFGPRVSNKIDETPITGQRTVDPTREAPRELTGPTVRRPDTGERSQFIPPLRPTKIDYQRIENIDGKPTVVIKQAEVKWGPVNKKRDDSSPVYATTIRDNEGNFLGINIDDEAIRKAFPKKSGQDKPWTKGRTFDDGSKLTPLKPNDIRTEEEWVMFNLFHELNHASYSRPFKVDAAGKPLRDADGKIQYTMLQGIYENGANVAALRDLKNWRRTGRLPDTNPDVPNLSKLIDDADTTLTGMLNKVKLTTTTRLGRNFYDDLENPEVNRKLKTKITEALNIPDTEAASTIIGLKEILFKKATRLGDEIAINRVIDIDKEISPEILEGFKKLGLSKKQIRKAIDLTVDHYGPVDKFVLNPDGTKLKVVTLIDPKDSKRIARQLATKMGGGRHTADILTDKLAEQSASQGRSIVGFKQSMLRLAINQASKLNAIALTGKVSGRVDPHVNLSPNIVRGFQRKVTSEVGQEWKWLGRGEVGVRDLDDFGTYQGKVFGENVTPWQKLYEGLKLSGKNKKLKESIDNLIADGIRHGTGILNKTKVPLTPEIKTALIGVIKEGKKLHKFGQELQGKGIIDELVTDYFPISWNRTAIEKNEDEFVRLLLTNNVKQRNSETGKMELIDTIEKATALKDGMLDIKYHIGNDTNRGTNSFFYSRTLDVSDEFAFSKFLDTDINSVLTSYYWKGAKALAKHDILGVRNLNDFKRIWGQAAKKEIKANGGTSKQAKAAVDDMVEVYKSITGEGLERYGPFAQNLADGYMLANRMALLPLSTLSSLTEIFINISKAGPSKAFRGYRDALLNGTRKVYNGSMDDLQKFYGLTRAEARAELNKMGIALDQALADYGDRLGGDALSNPRMRKWSNKFFRLNLLDQWTKTVQMTSYITGRRLIGEHLEDIMAHQVLIAAGKTSRRVQKKIDELADLGIDYKDGIKWIENGASFDDPFYRKVKEGAGTYTNEVILNPSAASGLRPSYMSNPQTTILGQLLGYPAAFTNTILKGMAKQTVRNPETFVTQHLPAAAIMTGAAVLTNAARSGGESFEKEPHEIIGDAFVRWGGNGLPADMWMRGRDAARMYQNPVGWTSGLGPLQGDLFKLYATGNIISVLGGKVPGTGAFKAVFEPFELTEDLPADWRKWQREWDRWGREVTVPEKEGRTTRDYKKGGEVLDVPQVPVEPDERIDKMTGLPYNVQAGGAFIDEEDRKAFIAGSLAKPAVAGAKALGKKGTNIIKGLFHGSPRNPSKLNITETLDQNKYSMGRGIYASPDRKIASQYTELEPFKNKKGKIIWKEGRDVGSTEQRWRDERIERGGDEPTLLEIEAHIDDGEIFIVGKSIKQQHPDIQKKLLAIAKDYNFEIPPDLGGAREGDFLSRRIFFNLYKKLEEDPDLSAEDIFKKYGIKAAKRDLKGSSLEGLSKGGDEEYAFYDDSILTIIERTNKVEGGVIRKSFALGTVASKTAPVLKSVLNEALDFLAKKGENITISRLGNRLKDRGVRQDEMKSSGITKIIEAEKTMIGKDPKDLEANFLNVPGSLYENSKLGTLMTTTRKGNLAITPEGLRAFKELRDDKPLIDTQFITARENLTEHYDKLPHEPYAEDQMFTEDPIFSNIYEQFVPKDVNTNTYEVIVFRDPRAEATEQTSSHFQDINIPKGKERAAELMGSPYSYHVRFDIVGDRSKLAKFITSKEQEGIKRLRVFEMQTDLFSEGLVEMIESALLSPSKWQRQLDSPTTPKHLKSIDDPYDVLLAFDIDKKQIKFSKQESKKLTKDIKELAKLTREQEEGKQLIKKAASELEQGQLKYPKLYEIYNGWRKSEIGWDEYMERLRELGRWHNYAWAEPNQLPDNIRSGIRNYTNTSKENKRAMLDHKVTAFLEPTFTALWTVPLPDINVSQNIINRMVAEAKDREIKEVSFLIGKDTPESKEYMGIQGSYYDPLHRGYLQRSPEVQQNYETVIEDQVIATAKKIGGTHSWDKEGYLTITLPEKEFTLPMFKNQGGKVIGSLQRTRRAKGGYI